MNPISSFSFGKVIKTLIPGLIASVAVLATFEGFYQSAHLGPYTATVPLWEFFAQNSFVRRVALTDGTRATAFGAVLVPVSLMLGFFLNAGLWMWANPAFRRRVDRSLIPELTRARTLLEERARAALGTFDERTVSRPVPLQAFYLPLLDLDKLAFLSESYFSWYEFALNSAAALALATLAYATAFCVLACKCSVAWGPVALYVGIPAAGAALLIWFLIEAAERNLKSFQERFVWFVSGALHFRATGDHSGHHRSAIPDGE